MGITIPSIYWNNYEVVLIVEYCSSSESLNNVVCEIESYLLYQAIIGHGTFPVFRSKMFGKDPCCLWGNEVDDVQHMIMDRKRWKDIRIKSLCINHGIKMPKIYYRTLNQLSELN